MIKIDVTEQLDAPPDAIFKLLTDHANYQQFRGISDSKLIREGKHDRNGVGAQREIAFSSGGRLWEDITDYVENETYAYRIVKINPPLIKHKGGRATVKATETGCEVHWVSELSFRVPLLARVMEPKLLKQFDFAFRRLLREAETIAQQA